MTSALSPSIDTRSLTPPGVRVRGGRLAFGDELLNGEIFHILTEAKVVIEQWRIHYNTVRPHRALGYRPPAPLTIAPHRGDPPFAIDGLRAIAARQTPR